MSERGSSKEHEAADREGDGAAESGLIVTCANAGAAIITTMPQAKAVAPMILRVRMQVPLYGFTLTSNVVVATSNLENWARTAMVQWPGDDRSSVSSW